MLGPRSGQQGDEGEQELPTAHGWVLDRLKVGSTGSAPRQALVSTPSLAHDLSLDEVCHREAGLLPPPPAVVYLAPAMCRVRKSAAAWHRSPLTEGPGSVAQPTCLSGE